MKSVLLDSLYVIIVPKDVMLYEHRTDKKYREQTL